MLVKGKENIIINMLMRVRYYIWHIRNLHCLIFLLHLTSPSMKVVKLDVEELGYVHFDMFYRHQFHFFILFTYSLL